MTNISNLVRMTVHAWLGVIERFQGPMTILPLRRLYIERQVQPEMLTFVSTEEVVALFNM